MIRYEGSVKGFRAHGLRALRKAAMMGLKLDDPSDRRRLQRWLRQAMLKDLAVQIMGGGGVA